MAISFTINYMSKLSRYITGGVAIALAFWFIIFLGIINIPGVDLFTILIGLFFLIIGIFIIFNDQEDDIEEIKKQED